MLYLDVPTTLVVLAVFGALAVPVRLINRRVELYAGRARDLMMALLGRLVENVGGFRDIVASGRFPAPIWVGCSKRWKARDVVRFVEQKG